MAEKTVSNPQGSVAVTHEASGTVPTTREESRYQIPPVDIFESEGGLTVVVDLPGVSRESVEVRVDNGVLTIQGKNAPKATGMSVASEFALYDYFRQFQLSDQVDQEKISADLKCGVLTLRLPRMAKAQPRQIPIQVS